MRARVLIAGLLVALGSAAAGRAGTVVSVQLVAASRSPKPYVDPQLQRVAHAMQRNLAFNSFRLAASASLRLPAGGDSRALGPFVVRCAGPQQHMAIRVQRGSRRLVDTTVSLLDRKPFLLGGLPGDGATYILVFTAM